MIPIRDVIPSRTTPVVTLSLIGVTALAYLYQALLPPGAASRLIAEFGLIPATVAGRPLGLVASLFLHADWAHLLGNLLCLWIFGDNVEDRFGHRRFLLFYLGAGALAGLAQAIALPGASTPIIGASGAIAAVMGAYLVLFPHSRIVMLIWLLFYVDFIEIPAVIFLSAWFLLQILGGIGASASPGGIAFVAHASGFLLGLSSGRLLARRERVGIDWWDPLA